MAKITIEELFYGDKYGPWARWSSMYLLDKMNSSQIRIRCASLKLSAGP